MNELYRIELNPSADNFDLAVVPIDEYGSLGNLNAKILIMYGYDQSILKNLDLKKGYDVVELNGRPLLFVVTISNRRKTEELLRENLYKALHSSADSIKNRKLWIPLLGTGTGNLTYEQSWQTIRGVLNDLAKLLRNVGSDITIAIPDDEKGRELQRNLKSSNPMGGNGGALADMLVQGKHRFFLVGSMWGREDQADRFYDDGIWETGYDDRYHDIINSIRAGDFLIHKSTYPTKAGDSILRIKGWGRVNENPHEGTLLYVDWVEKGMKDNIRDMGYYRNTITEPSSKDLLTIITSLSPRISNRLITAIKDAGSDGEQTHIAGLLSDSDSGTDYLDIMPDVNSFAVVLAAKTFEPPLAVALLGRWGSGKSFFIRKLKDQIVKLSRRDSIYFCEGIAHVHFNAWSYMDANLWASITTRIFEGLSQYIKNDSLAKEKEREVEEQLTKDLSLTQDELKGLGKDKLEIEGQLSRLNDKRNKAKADLDKKINTLRSNTLADVLLAVDAEFDVKHRIEEAIRENPGIAPNLERLKKSMPDEFQESPEKFYERLRSLPVLFRFFVSSKDGTFNSKWLILTFIFLIGVPIGMYYLESYLNLHVIVLSPSFWFLITFITSLYVQGRKTYKRFSPFLNKMWVIRGQYLEARNNAASKFEQEEKALIQQIDYSKSELESINSQISSIIIVKSTIEFKIKNAKSTQALYDFIDKRCNSEDYKKHLGLVSLIRKDFETLSGLLMGHKKEVSDAADAEQFRKLFDKPLERIILYIDDLDRCPEERVVEVLEAVNLLMAFPLFIVVVGVDPSWVKNALTTKHKKQFSFKDTDFKSIEASDYLEKIFQISFHLKKAEDKSIKSMLRNLSKIQALPSVQHDKDVEIDITTTSDEIDHAEGYERPDAQTADDNQITVTHESVVKALTFNEMELNFIEDMSLILGDNPRLIKRYVNIYRIIKSHESISREVITDSGLQCILFLLALSLSKYKLLIPSLCDYLDKAQDNMEFMEYFSDNFSETEEADIKTIKGALFMFLSAGMPTVLTLKNEKLKKYYNFIRRFIF